MRSIKPNTVNINIRRAADISTAEVLTAMVTVSIQDTIREVLTVIIQATDMVTVMRMNINIITDMIQITVHTIRIKIINNDSAVCKAGV